MANPIMLLVTTFGRRTRTSLPQTTIISTLLSTAVITTTTTLTYATPLLLRPISFIILVLLVLLVFFLICILLLFLIFTFSLVSILVAGLVAGVRTTPTAARGERKILIDRARPAERTAIAKELLNVRWVHNLAWMTHKLLFVRD